MVKATKDMAGDVSQRHMLILLLVAVLWTGVGTFPTVHAEESQGVCMRACV